MCCVLSAFSGTTYSLIRYLNQLLRPSLFILSYTTEMFYLPPLRRLLLPASFFLAVVVLYRSSSRVPRVLPSFVLYKQPAPSEGIRVAIADVRPKMFTAVNASKNHLPPPSDFYYSYYKGARGPNSTWASRLPTTNSAFEVLWQCPTKENRFTNHIRLPNIVQNITQIPPGSSVPDTRIFWNPTIISLPSWSRNQYIVVSRIVTDGEHQENVMCEANICYTGSDEDKRDGEKSCMEDDLNLLGPAGGMRCKESPIALQVPPTPAEQCGGKYENYVDIPGFHDPRVFWSGRGEPLMMVNTQ